MRIYLAPRYSRREEMVRYKADLEALGHTVYGNWIEDPYPASEEYILAHSAIAADLALDDLREIDKVDTLIAFTELPTSRPYRGGRHVEMGYALGRDKTIIVVGPRENVFHCLGMSVYPDWLAALRAIEALR
jgi:hypothetical protein